MSVSLPPAVQDYFAGKNARDLDRAVSGFAPTAVVRDEGGDHAGPVAIRAWIGDTVARYDDEAHVRSAAARGDDVEVVAGVSGTFPGSPIVLRFSFTLKDDRIVRLAIAP